MAARLYGNMPVPFEELLPCAWSDDSDFCHMLTILGDAARVVPYFGLPEAGAAAR